MSARTASDREALDMILARPNDRSRDLRHALPGLSRRQFAALRRAVLKGEATR